MIIQSFSSARRKPIRGLGSYLFNASFTGPSSTNSPNQLG